MAITLQPSDAKFGYRGGERGKEAKGRRAAGGGGQGEKERKLGTGSLIG